MRLVTFSHGGTTRIGVATQDEIVDLSDHDSSLPTDMVEFLSAGESAMESARGALTGTATRWSHDAVELVAPIPRPPEFLAIGLNYSDHIEEAGLGTPEFPLFFNKQSSCVVGPGQNIIRPRVSEQLDYEAELGFVIGRKAKNVSREDAHEFIAGYLIVNDVSVRDWQFKAPTMTLGKSFDTHGPTGPWIVTPDELGDPHTLDVKTWLNDELRQDSNTRHLVYDCFAQVETLSTVFTLLPGTIISTGTPGGVGFAMDPPQYMRAGDRVCIEIEGIGRLENPVVDEA